MASFKDNSVSLTKAPTGYKEDLVKNNADLPVSTVAQTDLYMAKQVAKLSMQVAVLGSCLVTSWMCMEDMEIIAVMKDALRNYGFQSQGMEDPAVREEQVGPLHLRVWEMVVQFMQDSRDRGGVVCWLCTCLCTFL